MPALPQLLGQNYAGFMRATAEMVEGSQVLISRYNGELSNPPPEIAAVAPDFWQPKPATPVKAKPKTEAPKTQ